MHHQKLISSDRKQFRQFKLLSSQINGVQKDAVESQYGELTASEKFGQKFFNVVMMKKGRKLCMCADYFTRI